MLKRRIPTTDVISVVQNTFRIKLESGTGNILTENNNPLRKESDV